MDIRVDQALLAHFLAGNFGLPVAHENTDYTPSAGQAYLEPLVLQNDSTPGTLKHTNDTDGIFRVIVRYPLGAGAVPAKQKAQDIAAHFPVGARLTYAGLALTVVASSRQPGVAESGWFKVVLTMPYRAAIER